jgi:predicted TIM-barrel fold metal-dependent hydrolase
MQTKSLIFFGWLFLISGSNEQHYTAEDFLNVSKIDTHVHVRTVDESFLAEAAENNFRLITVNVDSPGSGNMADQMEFAADLSTNHPDRIGFITTFEMEGWDDQELWQQKTIDHLKKSFNSGALGVKVWKNIGMVARDENGSFVMIDDPRFNPIFNFISEQDKILLAHIGEPKNCWLPLEEMTTNNDRSYFGSNPEYHMYLHPEYPSYDDIIGARDRMLKKHPDLRFVGAHLGSMEWSLEMMADHLDKFPNVALEMAARIPHLQYLTQQNRDDVRNFFIKYQDRIIYATDLSVRENSNPVQVRQWARDTWQNDWTYFVTDEKMEVNQVNGAFNGLKLPRQVVDKIYRENAEKWFRGYL